jgi:polyisoprenoid-binding protein YceI
MPPPGETAVIAAPVAAGVKLPTDAPHFVVDSEASEIRLLVYRAGARAADSGFRLEIPVESFMVDPPAARAEEGEEFVSEVSEQARQATRDNMLGKELLDSASRPLIEIKSIALTGPRWNPTVLARATLHGATRDLRFPAAVVQQGDLLTVIASFRIRQSDFDLTPFTALGGGLQVRDPVDVRLHLVARRAN